MNSKDNRAKEALENMHQKPPAQPMAIVGMSCRLPNGANSPEQFWEMLGRGDSSVSSLAEQRFQWPEYVDVDKFHSGIDRAYLVDNIDRYDTDFFGILPKEAEMMDPQQRMLLELSWEALEYSGVKPSTLSGSNTGIFIGSSHYDYTEVLSHSLNSPEAFVGTGNVSCILANRISFFLNLKGPSFTVDTACSSSLFALSEAVNAIENGQCTQALVGAVGLILSSTLSVSFYQAGMLSRNSSCLPFDQSSDGYLRGEGGGMLLIKPLSEAQANGDNVLAVVKGCAINHGGYGKTITSPNFRAQANVITSAIESAGITPDKINYIETHGTGTPVGDPLEFQGVLRSFQKLAKKNDLSLRDNYCALGALKADIGHLESSAGMASIIKVILAMKYKKLPANKRLTEINERIKLSNTPFYMVQEEHDWSPLYDEEGDALPLRAGISSFGFGGTNAHVILEEAPVRKEVPIVKPYYIFAATARTPEQLEAQVSNILGMFNFDELNSANLSKTLVIGREHFPHRVACVYSDQHELREKLTAWLLDKQCSDFFSADVGLTSLDNTKELIATRQVHLDACSLASKSSDVKAALLTVAKYLTEGYDLDYQKLFDTSHVCIPLATYPFERKRYWVNQQYPGSVNSDAVSYKLLYGRSELCDNSAQLYRNVYTGTECFFTDHQVGGNAILPGVAFLELVRNIGQNASLLTGSARLGRFELNNVAWLAPMIAHGETGLWTKLEPKPDASIEFKFYASEVPNEESLYCRGNLSVFSNTIEEVTPLDILECLNEGQFQHFDAQSCYQFFTSLGITYGPCHQAIDQLYVDDQNDRVFAKIRVPGRVRSEFGKLVLHPSILDAALQAVIGFSLANSEHRTESINLPFALERLLYLRPLTTECWARVTRNAAAPLSTSNYFDIDIFDSLGRLSVSMQSLEMRKAPTIFLRSQHSKRERLFVPQWQKKSLQFQDISESVAKKTLVIGANEDQLDLIRSARDDVTGISVPVNPAGGIEGLLALHSETEEIVLVFKQTEEVIGLDRSLIDKQREVVSFFLSFVKALAKVKWSSPELALTFITEHSATGDRSGPWGAVYQSLHGMIGSFSKEYPNWKVRLIDSPRDVKWNVSELFGLPFDRMGNAIRSNGTSYSQQVLVREDIKSSGDPIYKKGGVYLIIGGAGGIGELLTEHLLEKYQAKVVWLGRRELSKAIAERLDRLALSGPMPMYLQGDATSLEDMQKVHQAIISEYGEVNGVIHSAMVLDDATLATMSQNSLNQVLQAKVDTSVNMAHVFSEELLDFVLFFSSVNSFYKAPGQSNYVAGCCFTDVLSDILRQRMSCKIKVVNWGYWGTIGAVAELRYQKGMEKMGFASIDPDLAMSFLDRFMQSDNSVGCYVSVANDSVNLGLPIIDDSVDQLQDESPDSGNMLSDIPTLIKGDKHEVVSLLRSYILRNAASALYLEASELDSQATPFEDVVLSNYGLDSLLSSNLRYQILKDTEVDLPVQMFIGDKISQIIDELYQQLLLNHVSSGQEQQDSEEFEQFVF